MRIAHFLQVARIAQRHGMINVLKCIEDDLIVAFREAVKEEVKEEVKQTKWVIYRDQYTGITHTFAVPNRVIMSYMPDQKLEAVKQYKALVGCSLMQAKRIVEDYAHLQGCYATHVPSGCCTFE